MPFFHTRRQIKLILTFLACILCLLCSLQHRPCWMLQSELSRHSSPGTGGMVGLWLVKHGIRLLFWPYVSLFPCKFANSSNYPVIYVSSRQAFIIFAYLYFSVPLDVCENLVSPFVLIFIPLGYIVVICQCRVTILSTPCNFQHCY